MKFKFSILFTLLFSSIICLAGPGGTPPNPGANPPPPGFPLESNFLIVLMIVFISFFIFKKTYTKQSK